MEQDHISIIMEEYNAIVKECRKLQHLHFIIEFIL